MVDTVQETPHDRRRIAVLAEVDPATVAKFLAGGSVRPLSRMRIERAMVKLGLHPRGEPKEAAIET
jgi:DNA-binding LacI/PurR family transcriptional regulator